MATTSAQQTATRTQPPTSNVVTTHPLKSNRKTSGLPEATQCTFALSLLLLLASVACIAPLLLAGHATESGRFGRSYCLSCSWEPRLSDLALLDLPTPWTGTHEGAVTHIGVYMYDIWAWQVAGPRIGAHPAHLSRSTSTFDWSVMGIVPKQLDTKTPAILFIISAALAGLVFVRYLFEMIVGFGLRGLGPPPPTCLPTDMVRARVRTARLESTKAASAGTIFGMLGLAIVLSLSASAALMSSVSKLKSQLQQLEDARPKVGGEALGVMWGAVGAQVVALGLFAWFWLLSNKLQRREAEKRRKLERSGVDEDVELQPAGAVPIYDSMLPPPPAYTPTPQRNEP